MPTIKTSFEGPERLWQTLEILVNEYASRIIRITITRGVVQAELDEEVELPGFGYDDLWRQLRQCRVLSFDYAGEFSLAVMKAIYRQIKSEGLTPSYILIHPSSTLKKTRDWLDLSILTGVGSTFMGLTVVESESIDDDAFVVAAGHSPKASVHNIVMGVKGIINEPL
jgi:hypothetical protein